jgi:ABC-type lipoprotein export system ATPase subunit
MATPTHSPISPYIQRVQVQGLFGQFDHDLKFGVPAPDNPNLLILYGENGTGKTTLLWLLYHLLDKRLHEGHRTYLARQRFKRISVTLSDGIEILAERSSASIGEFRMMCNAGGKTVANYKYTVEPNGSVKDLSEDKLHSKFVENLPIFGFGFLPHDRLTRSAGTVLSAASRLKAQAGGESTPVPTPVQASIAKAMNTARKRAIRASNEGQFSVNAIYTELIQRLGAVQAMGPASSVESARQGVLGRLERQAKLTEEYSGFGLISELQIQDLVNSLMTIPPERLDMAIQVLEPFLRGNEARLDALKALHIALTALVESVNSLYLNKRMTLHVEKGLRISTLADEQLQPDQLSSGEQELLILFCEVISALGPNTILFIDEPELSLNVSWQKNLLDALLRCASGNNVQFVIATHSIELLTRHRRNVTRLSSSIVGEPRPVNDAGGVEA